MWFYSRMIGYYVIMEGIFFYAGFAMMLALKRQNKMIGIGEQFEYIMRDESLHLAFGCDLINTIRKENPEIWTSEFQEEIIHLIKESVELEKRYAIDACPQGLLGINAESFCDYVEYIADRRLLRIELPKQYKTENPFPWMSQATANSWSDTVLANMASRLSSGMKGMACATCTRYWSTATTST